MSGLLSVVEMEVLYYSSITLCIVVCAPRTSGLLSAVELEVWYSSITLCIVLCI